MNLNAADPRGQMIRTGNTMRIDNALVEEVSYRGAGNGYLLVSYSVPMRNGMVSIETLRLNVDRNTLILNSMGMPMCLCNVRKGMWISALFSSAMTRSIPPQSNAFFISVRRNNIPPAMTAVDRVASVDEANNFLYTGNPRNPNRQTRFVITENTAIMDRSGRSISLSELRTGQMVRVTHANFQTASIPPQTTAFSVQVI